jgi:hypothetical protein
MKKLVITFVHTEYHLLLFINRLINERKEGIENKHQLYLRDQGRSRVSNKYDLSSFEIQVNYINEVFNHNQQLNEASKLLLNSLEQLRPDEFVFYQEMDLLMVVLSIHYKKNNNTKIILYQDGLKPYNILRYNPISLIKHHHKTNTWLKKNNYQVDSWFSPLWSHRYAFSKAIDEVHLTFPEAYINWNNKVVKKIDFNYLNELKDKLEQVFKWKKEYLPNNERVILYLNQFLHDDGKVEVEFIKKLTLMFPDSKLMIKPHPLATETELRIYRDHGFHIIDAKVPAELFILNMSNSIIISVNSTSMFTNNPSNKYFYIHKYLEKDIKRLQKYNVKNHPSSHISLIESIDAIQF